MSLKYYAYNWLINFQNIDINALLNFIESENLMLRRQHSGVKFMRFFVAVSDQNQLQKFSAILNPKILLPEWKEISYAEFISATLIEHDKNIRSEVLALFEVIGKYTTETSNFYQQISDENQDNNDIYRTTWKINRHGVDNSIVEQAFRVLENMEDVYIAMYAPSTINYIDFYIAIKKELKFDEIRLLLPDQIATSDWVKITSLEVPETISSAPYKKDANLYIAWREGLYERLRKIENKSG